MARIIESADGKETELHIDGEFVASWRHIDLPDNVLGIVCNMIEQAVEHGERKKAAEIRKALGYK